MKRRTALAGAGIAAAVVAGGWWRQRSQDIMPGPPQPSPPVVPQPQSAAPPPPPPPQPARRAPPEGRAILTLAVASDSVAEIAAALAGAYLRRLGYDVARDHDFMIGRSEGRLVHIALADPAAQAEIALSDGYTHARADAPGPAIGLIASSNGAPARFAIRSEDHPAAQRITLSGRGDAAAIGEFIAFALSREGQEAIEGAGAEGLGAVLAEQEMRPDAPADYARVVRRALRTSFTLRFRPGGELDWRAHDDLQRIADLMREPQNSGRQLRLLGFAAGDQPNEESRALALAIAARLEELGAPVGEVLGLGDALPLDSNETPAGRWRNRRVEVWINR